MRFWDSSAVIPLLIEQPSSAAAKTILDADPDIVAWWSTPIECASAIARIRREGVISDDEELWLGRRLRQVRDTWYEVIPGDRVRDHALRLLRVHPLRAADALQLAAACEWSGSPASGTFVTFDDRLATAANREGFNVLGR